MASNQQRWSARLNPESFPPLRSSTNNRKRRRTFHTTDTDIRNDGDVARIDLGSYEYDADPDAVGGPRDRTTWRADPEESLSDWTIVVTTNTTDDATTTTTNTNTNDNTNTYHVHTYVLGAGERRSDYFRALFRNKKSDLVESRTRTSRISLRPSAAKAFPRLLDHAYGGRDCCRDADTAVALRSLARYFGVRSLHEETSAFIQRDVDASNVCSYLLEGAEYLDEKLVAASLRFCATDFASLSDDSVRSLPPDLLGRILTHEALRVESGSLSRKIAAYCRGRSVWEEGDVVAALASLTDPAHMPTIHPSEALYFLNLCLKHDDVDEEREEETESAAQHENGVADAGSDRRSKKSSPLSSLRSRCEEAAKNDWRGVFRDLVLSKRPRTNDDRSSLGDGERDHHPSSSCCWSDLSDSVKVSLLEGALVRANQDLVEANERFSDAVTSANETVVNANVRIKGLETQLRNKTNTVSKLRGNNNELRSEVKTLKKQQKSSRKSASASS